MDPLEIIPSDYHKRMLVNRANIRDEDSFLSKSVLWELDSCSLYKWRYCPDVFEHTPASIWGLLVDCMATTPELEGTELVFSPFDSFRSNAAKEWKAEQEKNRLIIVDEQKVKEARKAAKMLLETNKTTAAIFEKSKKQVVIAGRVLGCNYKGLVDIAPEGEEWLGDLKTTAMFSREGFARMIASKGYHMQLGAYCRLWTSMFPNNPRHRAKLIFQDSEPPYECCVVEIAQRDLEEGWAYASILIERILEATDSGHWPMAFEKEMTITRPAWASIQEEAKITQ